ncbi:MAG: membrane protein insertion efficiency factor YidD [Pseudomonadota bacterium]
MAINGNKRSFLTAAALLAIKGYKLSLSPLFYFLGARCRHLPSCSDYAAQAIQQHGAWRGGWLAFSRLTRCHPWGSAGFDPPPERLADSPFRPWAYGDWSWKVRNAQSADQTSGQTTGRPIRQPGKQCCEHR